MLVKIGIGLPNQVRNLNAGVIPGWAAKAEQAGFSTLILNPTSDDPDEISRLAELVR
jgi:hypothetical protein